ncbi:hypothetical protein CO667_11285 [Rhizobium sp. L43]|nr:hypothetical protein CO667_11285 [Rhizobium sp. L43]
MVIFRHRRAGSALLKIAGCCRPPARRPPKSITFIEMGQDALGKKTFARSDRAAAIGEIPIAEKPAK